MTSDLDKLLEDVKMFEYVMTEELRLTIIDGKNKINKRLDNEKILIDGIEEIIRKETPDFGEDNIEYVCNLFKELLERQVK
jgi:NAD+--asparagine ADP-ribosyltransferase